MEDEEAKAKQMENCSNNGQMAMQNPTTTVSKDDVIAKLKDDGDFDNLRLRIIRKLKENEELRSNIISTVRQSEVLNQAGAASMKPRQLSDAIFDEAIDVPDSMLKVALEPELLSRENDQAARMLAPGPIMSGFVMPRLHELGPLDEKAATAGDDVSPMEVPLNEIVATCVLVAASSFASIMAAPLVFFTSCPFASLAMPLLCKTRLLCLPRQNLSMLHTAHTLV